MTSRPTYVLDSFALLALFRDEVAADTVEDLIRLAQREEAHLAIATVNLGEVAYRVEREFGFERVQNVLGKIVEFQIDVVDVDRALALMAARYKAIYKMSYADCIATALAQRLEAPLVTGDPDFQQVEHLVSVEWLPRDI